MRWQGDRATALLCVLLCLNAVAGRNIGRVERADVSPTTTTAQASTTLASTGTGLTVATSEASSKDSTATHVQATSDASGTLTTTSTPTAADGASPSTTDLFNTTLADGELPLQPQITPGWGVAGAILLLTGLVFTFGIKADLEHLRIFFSSAYLASLGTTVLIVYVMKTPVSNGIQGAYVAAVVCTGAILGGGATIFKELTEGLGCLLGGFCVGMWFLTLRHGGLVSNNAGRIVFLLAFTAGGYAFYFSRYTRYYALSGLTSFAGATATVLGIDCFSRAGLKEFWVYIWALNKKIFAAGTSTYPLTKGIKVEIAVIIVIALAGLAAQLKVWATVRRYREKQMEVAAEAQRSRDAEEAKVGQRIEEQNARERDHWEVIHGGKVSRESDDSGLGEMHEKESRPSVSTNEKHPALHDAIEMMPVEASSSSALPDLPSDGGGGLRATRQHEDGRVTVRVAADDETLPAPIAGEDDNMRGLGSDGEARSRSSTSVHDSQKMSVTPVPDVVPLPFRVPENLSDDEEDKSSVAALVDRDDRPVAVNTGDLPTPSQNSSSRRFSKLPTRMSHVSELSSDSGEEKELLPPPGISPNSSGDGEEIDWVQRRNTSDDTGSIAATLDDMSMDGKDALSIRDNRWSTELTEEVGDQASEAASASNKGHAAELEAEDGDEAPKSRPQSTGETVATGVPNVSVSGDSIDPKTKEDGAVKTNDSTEHDETAADSTSLQKPPMSPPTSVSSGSTPANLTKDSLPFGLSRVALSYRTNEWAKHLSHAEMPEPEKLQIHEYPVEETTKKAEAPAPVDVESLQQTAANAIPAPALAKSPPPLTSRRYSGGLPSPGQSQDVPRRSSWGAAGNPARLSYGPRKPSGPRSRRTSANVVPRPIFEEGGNDEQLAPAGRMAEGEGVESSLMAPPDFKEQPAHRKSVPGVVSYSSPQTLLGQRESYIRDRSQGVSPGLREASPQPSSENSSVYNDPAHYSAIPDDLPLSQRRQLIRQSNSHNAPPLAAARTASNTPVPLNSHQAAPQRSSAAVDPQAARDARMASFRQSVANDLRAGAPMLPTTNQGRESPFPLASNPNRASLTAGLNNSSGALLGTRNAQVRRSVDQSRTLLMRKKEEEAQRQELEWRERDRINRAAEERMRHGDLHEAHREAMHKMQRAAKHC